MAKDKFGRVIQKKELQSVLNTMVSNNRKEGFMDFVDGDPDGKLQFFDSDPMYDGKKAVKVEMAELLEWILN